MLMTVGPPARNSEAYWARRTRFERQGRPGPDTDTTQTVPTYPEGPAPGPAINPPPPGTLTTICSACTENKSARQAWHRVLRIPPTGDTPSRYCTPCGVNHPPEYFSRVHRCIGRLGNLRLCHHEGCVVAWETVVKYGRTLSRMDLPEPVRVRLLICRDESHLPPAGHCASNADADEAGWFPSLVISGSRTTAVKLCMEWTGHVRMLGLGVLNLGEGEEKKITRSEMTSLLRGFRRYGPAEYIVPELGPDSIPEMGCFDPDRCGCLNYAGEKGPPKDRGGMEYGSPGRQASGCFPPKGPAARGVITGTHTSRYTLGRDSETRIDINPCTSQAQSNCLAITYRRTILVAAEGEECRGVTQSWFEAIDPSSYAGLAFRNEKTPFDALACPRDDEACANYRRYLVRPVVRGCAREGLADGQRPGRLGGGIFSWETGEVAEENVASVNEEMECQGVINKVEGGDGPSSFWGHFQLPIQVKVLLVFLVVVIVVFACIPLY